MTSSAPITREQLPQILAWATDLLLILEQEHPEREIHKHPMPIAMPIAKQAQPPRKLELALHQLRTCLERVATGCQQLNVDVPKANFFLQRELQICQARLQRVKILADQ